MSITRQRMTLIGIFALFIGPVILVILMRSSWWQYQPASLKNHGHLIQPPTPLSLDRAPGAEAKWLVLYVLDDPCEKTCIEHATALRQIHRAAGRHNEHLAIGLLSHAWAEPGLRARLKSIYPEFELLSDHAETATTTLSRVNAKVLNRIDTSIPVHTYVLDPALNVILAYQEDSNPNDIHKDLRRLLKWSDQEKKR